MLFKDDDIYDNLSPKGKLVYLKDGDNKNACNVTSAKLSDDNPSITESEEIYDLGQTALTLTGSRDNKKKILDYINKQNGPKSIPQIMYDFQQLLGIKITDSDTRWILSCIIAYSDDYYHQVIKIIGS